MPHLPTLLIQVGVILIVARLVGFIFRKIHQPQVMGEMVAGILLGPSLLGWIAPNLSVAIFPPESLGFLNSLSQIGLLIFMFLVGLELDPQVLRGRKHAAVVTSHVSIIAPFLLGTALALYLYPRLSDDSVSFVHYALFIGIAMSITAFPVLARILTERKLLRTPIGSLTIACAAVDDVTGWTILAGVVLLVRADQTSMPLWLMILGAMAYTLVMLLVIRPLLNYLESLYKRRGTLSQDIMAIIFLLVLASSLITELLGIHALFGAFLAGAIMPKQHGLVHVLTEKLEDISVILLLPIFFAFTGLRTTIGLVSGAEMWVYCFLVILVAIVGKFGGSTIAARISGVPWREAGALGVLMNTRGLMELVVLNIGLDIGVLSPAMFTIMVLMALITTFMTTPLLEWIYSERLIPAANIVEFQEAGAAALVKDELTGS